MYVIKLVFGFVDLRRWMKDAGDHVTEVLDLSHASRFETREQAQALADSTAFAEYAVILPLAEAQADHAKWVALGMPMRDLPKLSGRWKAYAGEDLETVIEFYTFAQHHEDEISSEVYATWPDLMAFTKNFYRPEFSCRTGADGRPDYAAPRLRSFVMMVRKEADFETFEAELKRLLPLVTLERYGYKHFPILDHECSEYESRLLLYRSDDECRIFGGRSRQDLFVGSLRGAFEEIRSLYYGD